MRTIPYRWIMVAAGAVIGRLAIGAVFSLPVFLRPMADATGWSTTGIAKAMTIGFITSALASMIMGSLSARAPWFSPAAWRWWRPSSSAASAPACWPSR